MADERATVTSEADILAELRDAYNLINDYYNDWQYGARYDVRTDARYIRLRERFGGGFK